MATEDTDYYVYQNQEFELVMDSGIDLTAETGNVKLKIRKPDGTESEVTPDIEAPPSAGLLSYTFDPDDLDQTGDWYIKSYLVTQKTPGRSYVMTVLGPWEKTGLPSAVEIRTYLEGYCVTEAKISNLWIAQRRDAVVKWVEMKTRQNITATKEYTEYLSGTGSPIVLTSRRPIISLDKLTYVVAPGDFAPTLSSVEVIHEEGVLKAKDNFEEARYPLFPKGKYNIKIVYTAGFSVMPDEIYEAVMALTCEKVLGALASQNGGGGSISASGYTRNYGARGKYTEARNDLARWGVSLLRKYMTGVVPG